MIIPAETEARTAPIGAAAATAAAGLPTGLLGAAGAGLAGLAAGRPVDLRSGARSRAGRRAQRGNAYLPFYGVHQAGIVTPVQDRLHFAAFDVTTDSRDELVELLQDWTVAAARMTQGLGAGELGPTSGPVRRAAGRHRRGDRPAAGRADHHLRLRSDAVPHGGGKDRFGLGRPSSRRHCSGCRTSRPTTWTRPSPTATSASRPAPTTRRSRCTRSATWPGSPSAGLRCAGPSSASGVRPRPRPARTRRGTCWGSRTAR